MRFNYQGIVQDEQGEIQSMAKINVYLANTNTLALIYSTLSSQNPITGIPQLLSDSKGGFKFWVDDNDYEYPQRFKIRIEPPVSGDIVEYDNIEIIEPQNTNVIESKHTPVYYTVQNTKLTSHLSGIDSRLMFMRLQWCLTGTIAIHNTTTVYSYTGDLLTGISLSGGVTGTATFSYTGDKLTQEVWSVYGKTVTITHQYTGDKLTQTVVSIV